MIYEIGFKEVLPLWRSSEMWGDDEVKPVSSMLYYDGENFFGGNNLSVYDFTKSNPRFFGYFVGKKLVGVISCFDIDFTARLRGLYVKPEYRMQGISTQLLLRALEESEHSNNLFAWALAGPNSMRGHEKVGFRQVTSQLHNMPDGNVSKHHNCYMRYDYA